MSNTNTNFQTQTSNALHNAIMEAGGKDRPPMLAPEGSSKTTTKGYMEKYKNVSQDIRDQLNAEAEAVQIIITGIDNDIYSTVDACPNALMWREEHRVIIWECRRTEWDTGGGIVISPFIVLLSWEVRASKMRVVNPSNISLPGVIGEFNPMICLLGICIEL
ncbi:hypothetical protein Tco_0782166 [Tanacetum coccineum]